MSEHITDKMVKGLAKPAKGNRIIYDADKGKQKGVAGFGVRITAGGAKAFVITYRNADGRSRRLTIGRYGAWSVERARRRAKELRQKIDTGADPLEEKITVRKAPTVAHLCDDYIKDHLPRKRPSSQYEDKAMITKIILPKLGTRKVASVRYAHIEALHRSMRDRPVRANRVAALLSKMFNLAIRWEYCDTNPVRGLERYDEEPRTKYLNPKEIERLTTALDEHADQRSADVVRLCLLTGCRIGEALGAEWDQLDLEGRRWVKPAATVKQKHMHDAPLSVAAAALLKGIHADAPKGDAGVPESRYVFPGRAPDTHLDGVKRFWQAIRKAAGLDWLRLHDLRHTYASILASAGASLPMIGALLGHTKADTTLRYAHFFDDPLRKLTDQVGHVVNGTKPAEVVPLRKGA